MKKSCQKLKQKKTKKHCFRYDRNMIQKFRSQGQGLGTGLSQRMQQAAGQAAAHAAINELKDSFRMSNRH
uniref:Uncharacterized protein n=1 Tax=Timema cristinae TaxID=61476 RepID=A0A7R9CRG5_TIMCR|nr:unnamed protein product [Timema cristinae]